MNKDTKSAHKCRVFGAFTLAEMLIVLMICSIILIAMAPVMTQRKISGSKSLFGQKSVEITYGSKYCNYINSSINACTGEFQIPPDAGESIDVTVVAGGGGGGGGTSTGSVEYTSAGTYDFIVPYGVNEIEVTLVGGGAGGGAGNVDSSPKTITWSHDQNSLNTSYVSASYIPNVKKHNKVGSDKLVSATGYLYSTDTKYFFSDVVMATVSAGGGGGGRGYEGAGGGGGAAKREVISILKDKTYTIRVGAGGKGHSCCGLLGENAYKHCPNCENQINRGSAGCGGGATYIKDPNGNIVIGAGGGGGGAWGVLICDGMNGEDAGYTNPGAKGGKANGGGFCTYKNKSIFVTGGGVGASPNGQDGKNGICSTTKNDYEVSGAQGGGSLFGSGGQFVGNVYNSPLRHGQGYGAGGCGGGYSCPATGWDCPGKYFTGNGAPGFAAISFHEVKNGGGGGGSGSIVPLQRYKVTPGEKLTVVVGEGGKGGESALLSSSFLYTYPKDGMQGKPSLLKRGNKIIVMTGNQNNCNYGACHGLYSGVRGNSGYVFKGGSTENNFDTTSLGYSQDRFYTGNSQYAGGYVSAPSSYTQTMRGGDGGKTIIDGNQFCKQGSGANVSSSSHIDATGFGGCGGGGGYGNVRGGNGAPGYVKITWNPDKKGRGGGGASGNTLKKKIYFTSNIDKVKVQIGNGGLGGILQWGENPEIQASKGGDTIFGSAPGEFNLRVGGGEGGKNAGYENGVIYNGEGGTAPSLCAFEGVTGLSCLNGDSGSDATDIMSGAGASTTYGSGGFPVQMGNGNQSISYGAGGSGGGVLHNATQNEPSARGGSGGSGKIIIEW